MRARRSVEFRRTNQWISGAWRSSESRTDALSKGGTASTCSRCISRWDGWPRHQRRRRSCEPHGETRPRDRRSAGPRTAKPRTPHSRSRTRDPHSRLPGLERRFDARQKPALFGRDLPEPEDAAGRGGDRLAVMNHVVDAQVFELGRRLVEHRANQPGGAEKHFFGRLIFEPGGQLIVRGCAAVDAALACEFDDQRTLLGGDSAFGRSEEHTSELQSLAYLV